MLGATRAGAIEVIKGGVDITLDHKGTARGSCQEATGRLIQVLGMVLGQQAVDRVSH